MSGFTSVIYVQSQRVPVDSLTSICKIGVGPRNFLIIKTGAQNEPHKELNTSNFGFIFVLYWKLCTACFIS